MATPIINPDEIFPSEAGEIWYVPNRAGTAVVRIPAFVIVRAISNSMNGVEDGWAPWYIPLLLNARTTRERDLSEGPEEAELEAAFRRALMPGYSTEAGQFQRAP